MKKSFGPVGALAFCILLVSIVCLTGCSKNQDAGVMPAGGPGTPPPMPGGATAPVARPGATTATAPVGPNDPIAFDLVPGIMKPIKTIVEKDKEAKMVFTYKRFKYKDWDGNICVCQIPDGETKVKRTKDAWLATFDIYKVLIEKKKVSRMHDFPFVSPPPGSEGGQGNSSQQQLPKPGTDSSSIPAPGATPPPGR